MEKKIAIIPARGGSKRIPRKNIKLFLDKPIIAYSIEAALKSELFDEVMVSTDDPEIAEIAISYGAKVPFFRSELNSNDIATTTDVLIEVLEQYKINQNISFEYACCLYPTAPLVQVKEILEGFNLIKNHGFDSVFPIVAFSYPVWRSLFIDKDSRVKMQWPEFYNSRSQDLKTLYHDAGQWYWFQSEILIREKKLYMNNSKGLILDETKVQDIDSLTDFNLAEIKFKELNK